MVCVSPPLATAASTSGWLLDFELFPPMVALRHRQLDSRADKCAQCMCASVASIPSVMIVDDRAKVGKQQVTTRQSLARKPWTKVVWRAGRKPVVVCRARGYTSVFTFIHRLPIQGNAAMGIEMSFESSSPECPYVPL